MVDGSRQERRNAEISDMPVTVSVDHDIGRLQVPMQDAMIVRGAQSGAQFPGELHGPFTRESAGSAKQ